MICPGCGVELPAGCFTCPGCSYDTTAADGGPAWKAMSPEKRDRLVQQSRKLAQKQRRSRPLLRYADEYFDGDAEAALEALLRSKDLPKIRQKLYKDFWPDGEAKEMLTAECRRYLYPVVARILDEGYPGGIRAASDERRFCDKQHVTPRQLRETRENPYFTNLGVQGLILLGAACLCALVCLFSVKAGAILALLFLGAVGASGGEFFAGTLISGISLRSLQRRYERARGSEQWERYRENPELYDMVRDLFFKPPGEPDADCAKMEQPEAEADRAKE